MYNSQGRALIQIWNYEDFYKHNTGPSTKMLLPFHNTWRYILSQWNAAGHQFILTEFLFNSSLSNKKLWKHTETISYSAHTKEQNTLMNGIKLKLRRSPELQITINVSVRGFEGPVHTAATMGLFWNTGNIGVRIRIEGGKVILLSASCEFLRSRLPG